MPKTIISDPVRFRYMEAHRKHQLKKHPESVKDHGYIITKYPDTRKKAGLETFICNWFKWNGHHMEKTNNMGKPIQKMIPKYSIWTGQVHNIPGGIEWHKGGGTKGTADMKGWVNLPNKTQRVVLIESKIKDTQSSDQKKYEEMVTDTGAIYLIIKNPESIISWYDGFLLAL